jgi:hypothetical protein
MRMAAFRNGQMRHPSSSPTLNARESRTTEREADMPEQTAPQPKDPRAAEALRLLDAAWAYYTPGPVPELPASAFDEAA